MRGLLCAVFSVSFPCSLAVSAATLAPALGQTTTVPGVVNGTGAAGSLYVSDLTITNAGSTSTNAVINFIPAAGSPPPPFSVSINAGVSMTWVNVLDQLFGASETYGMLRISSDLPSSIRAKTYNNASVNGTYVTSLPVMDDSQLLTAGTAGESIWFVNQPVSGGSGYRSNVAIGFPLDGGGTATARVYDATGAQVGHDFTVSSSSPGFFQTDAQGFGITTLPIGRTEIQVSAGSAIGYVVNNDNVTSDSSVFAFQLPPSTGIDVALNGVSKSAGAAGTYWRTDGRLWNPTAIAASVTVSWFKPQFNNSGAATATVSLQPGELREIVDLLGSFFGAPNGSSGALRFQSASPIVILGRTSNVDPTGVRAGTFGAQQNPIGISSFLTAGSAALVTSIEQDSAFRTNIGFLAGSGGASYGLTLLSPAGVQLAAGSGGLGPFGWTQPNITGLFPGISIPAGAQLRIDGVAGSLSAYDSKIDNASGDPIVTLETALPPSCIVAGPMIIAFDCAQGAADCSQIMISGDPVDTTTPSSFYGNVDPSVRRDPNGSHRLYLTYSFPMVIAGTSTPTVEIHVAESNDGGRTWSFVAKLWPWVKQPDGNYSSHEVSNLAAQDQSGVTTWYGVTRYYEVTPGGPLYGSIFTPSAYFVLTSEKDPALLGSSPDDWTNLNFGGTTSAYSSTSYPNLTTIAGDPACTTWREPALMVQGDTLYLAAQCALAGGAFSYYGIFATPTAGRMSTWTWKYLGKLFQPNDAAQLLPTARSALITELDLTQKPNGPIIAIMTVMDQGINPQQKYGSRTADVATLGNYDTGSPPAMARDCTGHLMLTGQFTASDLNVPPNQGPGASCYEAADPSLGVLFTRRDMTPNVHGFIFRTGKFSD
jgi:hypothetical protein